MKRINSYDSYFRLNEKLHINQEVDKLSQFIFDNYGNKEVGKYIINIDPTINIIKIILYIVPKNNEYIGLLKVNKCYKDKNGNWIMYINIIKNFKLEYISHEISHAFELTRMGKDKLLNKLTKINRSIRFEHYQIINFFNYIYLISDEEISSIINESYSYIKDYLKGSKVKSNLFKHLVTETKGFRRLKEIEDLSIRGIFDDKKDYQINNFLYMYEQNTIDNMKLRTNSFIDNIRYYWKRFKERDMINFTKDVFSIRIKYKPKRNLNYYDEFFKKQSEKLKKRLYGLYDHFS